MAKVLVPLAEGFEELEAVTVIDLLRRAGLEVISAGLTAGPVRASRGTVLVPDTTLDQVVHQDFDLVVLPGGLPGADHLNADPRLHGLLQRMHARKRFIAAICAAPRVLADAGLLEGRRATSFPGALDGTRLAGVNYQETAVAQDGHIITSRGPGTAMEFALALIELLAGAAARDRVERALMRPAS